LVDAALSNAVGAQIISVLVGVGLPSLIFAAASGHNMELDVGRFSGGMVMLMGCVVVYMTIILGVSSARYKKPVVDRFGGFVMLVMFIGIVAIIIADFYAHIFKFSF
jgi:Ca2+/Na+ antiporter